MQKNPCGDSDESESGTGDEGEEEEKTMTTLDGRVVPTMDLLLHIYMSAFV